VRVSLFQETLTPERIFPDGLFRFDSSDRRVDLDLLDLGAPDFTLKGMVAVSNGAAIQINPKFLPCVL
jgi:hypothetical protein